MIRRIVVCSALIFVIALPFASCEDKTPKRGSGTGSGTPERITAPNFSLQDITGRTWRLADHRGKVVFLNFTTTWCPWCLKDIPTLKKIYERYRNKEFEFVSIYIEESQKKVSSFAVKHKLPYKILLDPEGKAARSYGVRGVPTKVVVGRDGTITCWMCNDTEGVLERMLKK
ncbi:MAG TPA: TlpA disulfide reductase family protein [Deltaproteobacteria bacterium]|jgi:peroxiredoxin|nr:TlpA disulfide reductase family protein [Deltaproteobacteria bacterium]HQJ07384.1 TlpA disulfide reductase family protein [Deltaproteobacteria bacterium]